MEIPLFPPEELLTISKRFIAEAVSLLAQTPDSNVRSAAYGLRILHAVENGRLTDGLINRYCNLRGVQRIKLIMEGGKCTYHCLCGDPPQEIILTPLPKPETSK